MRSIKSLTVTAALICSLALSSSVGFAAESVKSDMKLLINGKDAGFTSQSFLVDSSLYASYEAVAKQ